jgi:sugar/nucleoside kinase (ribokinase family)
MSLRVQPEGDTTGCGDNFVGGVLVSVVDQLQKGMRNLNFEEACCWGIVSGGFTCFHMGGTYFEEKDGEKMARIRPYYESYKKQILH